MKRLQKMTVNSLRENFPVMCNEELSRILGGDGSGDCLFQAIAQATGHSVSEVQAVFAQWACVNQSSTYTTSFDTAYGLAGYKGTDGIGASYLLNYFGMSQVSTPIGSFNDGTGNGGVMVMSAQDQLGRTYAHAVNFLYGDTNGNYYYYDSQQHCYGSVSSYGDYTWSIVGVFH